MPLYEYRKNATNHVSVPPAVRESVVCGTTAAIDRALELLHAKKSAGRPAVAAIEGWYGVDWAVVREAMGDRAQKRGIKVEIISTAGWYRSASEIDAYRKPFVTDDPSFGYVNSKGALEDVLDPQKIAAFKNRLQSRADIQADLLVAIGPGAAVTELQDLYDLRLYADFTMQPLLWQMWDGKLVAFGNDAPATDYIWKKYYYCDFYLLLRQKKKAFARMDYYIDAVDARNLKLLPAASYNTIIDELTQGPIKQVKITQPGPWGSYRFRKTDLR